MPKKSGIIKFIENLVLFNKSQKAALLEKVGNSDLNLALGIYKELKKGLNDYDDLMDETYFITENNKKVLKSKYKEFGSVLRIKIKESDRIDSENEANKLLDQLKEI